MVIGGISLSGEMGFCRSIAWVRGNVEDTEDAKDEEIQYIWSTCMYMKSIYENPHVL